jgi:hypothetical protein
MKHSSVVGGSSAARVLACPQSIDLSMDMPEGEESSYAAEGTALHLAMEYLLDAETAIPPLAILGKTFYGQRMLKEHVNLVKKCLKAFDEIVDPDTDFMIEVAAEFPNIPGAFGTTDIAYFAVEDDKTVLGLIDWKFGAGIPVHAEGNAQGKFYLAALANHLGMKPDLLRFTIVQPRHDRVETAEYTAEDIAVFAVELHHAVFKRRYDDTPPTTGEHCRWCRAISICPSQRADMSKALKLREMANSLGESLEVVEQIEQFAKATRDAAHTALTAGEPVEGWKLVAKRGVRRWVDDAKTLRWMVRQRMKKDERYSMKILSPAQLEKINGGPPKRFIESVSSGTTIARTKDKRPPIKTGATLAASLADGLAKQGLEAKITK